MSPIFSTEKTTLKERPCPDDKDVKIVLCKIEGLHPYVTWRVGNEQVYFLGHYFKTLEEALEDFKTR